MNPMMTLYMYYTLMDIVGHRLAFYYLWIKFEGCGKKYLVSNFMIRRKKWWDLLRLQQQRTTDLEESD